MITSVIFTCAYKGNKKRAMDAVQVHHRKQYKLQLLLNTACQSKQSDIEVINTACQYKQSDSEVTCTNLFFSSAPISAMEVHELFEN